MQCVHLAILALSSDCEEGNKKAMELLEQRQKDGSVDPQMEFCVYLPDAVHVGKSCKCSFSNWFCLLDGSRVSLAVVHTLREDSDPSIKAQLRKLLAKEDVQNKDRMAIEPIIRLTSPDVSKVLSATKQKVVHTLIPDKFRPIDSNKVGLYPHPISICLGPKGKFFFLDYAPLKKETKLCLADLHNPVRVSVLKSGLCDAKGMAYLVSKGIALVAERGKKVVTVVEVEQKLALKPSLLKTKKSLQDVLHSRGMSQDGTIPDLRRRLQASLAETRKDYETSRKSFSAINMDKEVNPDRICAASDEIIAMASDSKSCLYLVELTLDGVGVTGVVKEFCPYPDDCMSVHDMYISNGTLFLSHNLGITKISLETREHSVLLSNSTPSCMDVQGIAPFGDQGETVFADMGSRQIKMVLTNGNVQVVAGLGGEGNSDGTRALFSQPMGICVENKRNIFVTDAQVGAIKLITDIRCAVKFLENLGKLYQAFSVHQKHKRLHTTSLQEAEEKVQSAFGYFQGTIQSVQTLLGTNKQTNGPEGTISTKSVKSVKMISQGLTRLTQNINEINSEQKANPEALLTVKVENLHAVSHFKHPTCMQLHYARDFGSTALESAKRMTRWSAFYFTHPTSYYPVPSSQIQLKDFPKMKQQNHPYMHPNDQDLMRKWANDHGKCVRQRTVRQETTKFKAGTLPLNMYETPVHRGERLNFTQNEDDQLPRDDEREDACSSEISEADQLSEYDEESSDDNDSVLEENGSQPQLLNKELGFLFTAARTRSGRMVRTSNKAVLWL